MAIAAGIAAILGIKWFSNQWWAWPPRNWKIARTLREVKREVAPPLQFLTAKTVYIEDRDSLANIQGTAYLELKKWGRFEVITDRAHADLVLSFFAKKPGVHFSEWNGGELDWLGGEARNDAFGYSFLKVTDPRQIGYLYLAATVWQSYPRSATRDLIRKLRKELQEAERWYRRK